MSEKKILLVEDNEDDIELTLRAIKKSNILNKVSVVRDGQEALDYLYCKGNFINRDPLDFPALILLDLQMPKLNGIEVLKNIRANKKLRLIPVVVLTSSKEEKDLLDGYTFGTNSYIQKPVDFNQFLDVAQQLGLYWMLLNVNPPMNYEGKNE
jgi:two-component system, response regulator